MRILLISDHAHTGGAAIAARRLGLGFSRLGHEVLHGACFSDNDSSIIPLKHRGLGPLFSFSPVLLAAPGALQFSRLIKSLKPDIIHLHNLHGAVEYGFSPSLVHLCSKRAPTAWTLHDMWSFTGRCAYRKECTRLYSSCSKTCESHDEYPILRPELIRSQFEMKSHIIEHSGVVGVAPSKWMKSEAQLGLWKRGRVEYIRNGIPLNVFNGRRREAARKRFQLSAEDHVLCFSAAILDDPRKGIALLWEALSMISSKVKLLIMGSGPTPVSLPPNVNIIAQKVISTESERADAFAAADITVHPASFDNLPNTIAESICVGTPVIGFAQGGVSEMLSTAPAGWAIQQRDAASLAKAISNALAQVATWDRSKTAAAGAKDYDLTTQSMQYIRLFDRLLASKSASMRAR